MLEVPATKFVKNVGQYKKQVQREAIAITSHGRTSGYFMTLKWLVIFYSHASRLGIKLICKAQYSACGCSYLAATYRPDIIFYCFAKSLV